MKKIVFGLLIMAASTLIAFGGETYSGTEAKQVVPPPCPEWYRDTEWNVSLWGTYVFTAEDWGDDRYIEADHAWGGGMDVKYFFHRYFGVGIEGWAVDAQRERLLGRELVPIVGDGTRVVDVVDHDSRIVGAVKGTFTLRYPFHCSRFSPYIYGGAGAIFGGGERDTLILIGNAQQLFTTARHSDGDPEFLGQVGAGFEYRLTPHIGLINDFSWNFVGKDNSDFGMVRAGVNFAF
jgi:hypothetical protein